MRKKSFMKLLIVGDDTYTNKGKVFNILNQICVEKNDLQLYMATFNRKYGAEEFVREFSQINNIRYGIFEKFNENWTNDCVLPFRFYNKEYSPKLFHIRNSKAINWCDMLIIFVNKVESDKNILKLKELAIKKNKPVFIYE